MPLDPNRLLERAFASCAADDVASLMEERFDPDLVFERGRELAQILIPLSRGFVYELKEYEQREYRAERRNEPRAVKL